MTTEQKHTTQSDRQRFETWAKKQGLPFHQVRYQKVSATRSVSFDWFDENAFAAWHAGQENKDGLYCYPECSPTHQAMNGDHASDERATYLAKVLRDAATDPMWNAHAEVSKKILVDAADLIEFNFAKAPTDISELLRQTADEPEHCNSEYAELMRCAAIECERFYGGMMNWKANAQGKDKTIIELREKLAAAPVATAAPQVDLRPTVRDLDRISMMFAADLAKMHTDTIKGVDYLQRDFVMQRLMEWRREWDANSKARPTNPSADAAPAKPQCRHVIMRCVTAAMSRTGWLMRGPKRRMPREWMRSQWRGSKSGIA